MSESPRTDAAAFGSNIKNQSDSDKEWPWSAIDRGWDFARQLERELTEANAHAARLQNKLAEVQAEKSDALIAAVEEIAAVTAERDAWKQSTQDERDALKKELLKVMSAFEENEEQWITRENELMSIIAGKGNA